MEPRKDSAEIQYSTVLTRPPYHCSWRQRRHNAQAMLLAISKPPFPSILAQIQQSPRQQWKAFELAIHRSYSQVNQGG